MLIIKRIKRYFQDQLPSRTVRTLRAIFAGFIGKGISLIVGLITIPITVNYLGSEGYGLYTTIASVLTWFQITNFGIGLGLQNALTEAIAYKDVIWQKKLVSTAIFTLFIILGIFTTALIIAFDKINWFSLFPSESQVLQVQTKQAVALAFGIYIITILLSLISPIYAALQKLDKYYYWNAAAQVFSLISLLVVTHTKSGLSGIVLGLNGSVTVIMLINAIWVLRQYDLFPSFSNYDFKALRKIFSSGIAFLIIQISMIFIFQTDKFVIAQYIGVNQVTPYTIGYKIFSTMSMIVTLTLSPLWPAYGEAKALGEIKWIKQTHSNIALFSFTIFFIFSIFIILFGRGILKYFFPQDSIPSAILLFLIAVYFLIKTFTDIYAVLINGLDMIAPQAISAIAQAVVTMFSMIMLVKVVGLIGIPLGGIIGYISSSAWFLPYLIHKYFKNQEYSIRNFH